MEEKVNKKKISMTIDPDLYNKFYKYCKYNGYKISTRMSILIERDLENDNKQ